LFKKTTNTTREERVWRATLAKTQAERVAFETMSISGKARIEGETGDLGNLSVSYRIDLIRDSTMIIRLSKFIEVARIKLDADSIYVLNRLEQSYTACDYSLAESYTGLQADFQTMQALFLGDFVPIPRNLKAEEIQALPQTFIGEEAGTFFRYFIDPLILRVVGIETRNEARGQASLIRYSRFETYGRTQMPQEIQIGVSAPETLDIGLDHRKVRLDESLNLSFDVPGNFRRASCDF
jgi:hypothetical protein